MRVFSILLLLAGGIMIAYGGFKIYNSHAMESKRLIEANDIVSNEIISMKDTIQEKSVTETFNYNSIQEGDTIGILYIPRLEREIPIIEGTDEEELAQGVGHYIDTGFPGENKQILLSGHRDTVFRNFGELKDGDEFHVKMEHGTFVYEIRDSETQIVPADDTTVIDPSRADEFLTVSTCYPFSYIGDAPDRYVIYAYPKY